MKKTKSGFSSGSANKNMDHQMLSYKQDKIQDNDFANNFNRKLTCQDPMQPMQYMQNPHKQMFQAKNKKKKDRIDNIMAPQGDKSQRVYSWRNFGNVSAFSQKKQQTFQRAGTQYMKKERANFMGQPQETGMPTPPSTSMHSQFGDEPYSAQAGEDQMPYQPQEASSQPEQPQYQQQQAPNNNQQQHQANIEIKIQINNLSFRNE